MTVLIVGASVAGLATAQALRTKGFSDRIVVLGEEPHLPYDKPPLSKKNLLPEGSCEPVALLAEEQLAALELDLRLGRRAIALDVEGRTVTSDEGETIPFDTLVIATGARPRTLPGTEDLAGVHTLRNIEDAVALRSALPTARNVVVVVGAGFIGAEFAAAAKVYGAPVVLVEAQNVPLADGVECEADLCVVGTEAIYAVGDVAHWPHAFYGEALRIEHWTNASDHAGVVAAAVTRSQPPAPTIPYVWSDQYGHRIQIIGRPAVGELAYVAGTLSGGDLMAAYTGPDGELVGAVVVDNPRLLMKCRKAIATRVAWNDMGVLPVA